ncbi:MAG: outer membrane beta-barrel protein [Cyclobacteriaceae bacterium]
MQAINTGHKFNIHWRKIALLFLLLAGFLSRAQNNPSDNLINYDEQWIHYGFLIGVHSSKYVIKHSEAFVSPAMDTVHSIIPGNLGGFKLGFITNMKITDQLDFRGSITIGFYEHDLLYRFTDNTSQRELKDATMVEFPMLLKYKSTRRGNMAMYVLGGLTPSFEAASKSNREDPTEKLELKGWNMAFEIGGGFDIYYPFFKFSPEIRYSYGLRNMLKGEDNQFSVGLERLTTQNLTVFVTFEGGPTAKQKRGGKIKGKSKRNSGSSNNKAQRKFKGNKNG